MIVGEARVGKTAVTNGIVGKPFVAGSDSTIGMEICTCDIKDTLVGSGKEWMNVTEQTNLSFYDSAIAREALIVQDQYMQQ